VGCSAVALTDDDGLLVEHVGVRMSESVQHRAGVASSAPTIEACPRSMRSGRGQDSVQYNCSCSAFMHTRVWGVNEARTFELQPGEGLFEQERGPHIVSRRSLCGSLGRGPGGRTSDLRRRAVQVLERRRGWLCRPLPTHAPQTTVSNWQTRAIHFCTPPREACTGVAC
jgi:hypothetical protein